MKKPPRLGRPPLFQNRVRLTVFLDAEELEGIQRAASAELLSASTWARRALVAAASKEGTTMHRGREQARRARRREGR